MADDTWIVGVMLFGLMGAFVAALIINALFVAHGQENVTPIVAAPTAVPNSNIELLPQKGYIVPLPPTEAGQQVQVNQDTGSGTAEATGIIGILTAVGMSLYAKFSGSRDVKSTNAALLNTKEVQKELARVMYNFQPTQAAALSDAPSIKLDNLEKDKAAFAEKVAKS